VLLVLALAVHPFELPDNNRAVTVEILPELVPPPTPTVEVQLRPRQPEATRPQTQRPSPQPPPSKPVETQSVPAPAPAPTPAPPVEVRPNAPVQSKPVEVERRAVQAPQLQTQRAAPVIPEAPPEPVEVQRQSPILQPQIEAPRAQSRALPLNSSRAGPQLPQPAASETAAPETAAPQATAPQTAASEANAPPAPGSVQVLTNENVIQAPVEIRPRTPSAAAPRSTALPGASGIPTQEGGAPPPGGGPSGGQPGAQAGGGARPSPNDFSGINGGFGTKGLRAFGCADPDAYKLTREERVACTERMGRQGGPDLGLPISSRNLAAYDRYEACQNSYRRKQGIPAATDKLGGQSVAGVNPLPKECLPLENR
jgi:hypothetical protein